MMGRNASRPWSSPTSELALDTSCPVCISSWRAKSSRCSCVVDGVAQVVLDVEADPAAQYRLTWAATKRNDGRQGEDAEPGRERRVVGDNHLVDDLPLDRGNAGRDGASHQGRAEGERHIPPMRPQPREQSPDPARGPISRS